LGIDARNPMSTSTRKAPTPPPDPDFFLRLAIFYSHFHTKPLVILIDGRVMERSAVGI
jgi:hypothetical protein